MILRGLPYRYARALFNLSHSKEEMEQRQKYFKEILSLLERNPRLMPFLLNPHISLKDKESCLQDTLSNIFDNNFLHFLLILIEKRRFKYISEIAKSYHKMVSERLGILNASVITALPLSAEARENIKKNLEATYHQSVVLSEEIDPKIIGGAILIVDNKILDHSIKGRLEKMKKRLLGA
jgi:F-type H+-transporting ATPase subunit delta